jgi:hypothetical protein
MLKILVLMFVGFNLNHDFHTSLSEINYNDKTKSLEISIRVFTDDLELALSEINNNKKIKIEGEKTIIDPLIEKYIMKHLAIISPQKKVKLIKYYGKEQEAEATWIYAEMADCENIKDFTLFNTLFTDLFTDQTNLVNITSGSQKKTMLFDGKTKISAWPF